MPRWSKEIDAEVGFQLTGVGRAYGPPMSFDGTQSYLYRNEGNGTFVDVSDASGIHVNNPATGRPAGKALAVLPFDANDDGWPDLFVANDTVQNFLFVNQRDGTFREQGALLGVAYDRNGRATGAMGVDVADYRNDGALGVAVGNFANEMTSLYVRQPRSQHFADEAILAGLGPATRLRLTFGMFFFDVDLDGRLDLLQANGHLEEEIGKVQASQTYRQPAQLFWNRGENSAAAFVEVPAGALGDLSTPMVARGAAYGDLDGDGDLDVVLTEVNGPARVLRNDQRTGHHWLRVRLQGPRGNPLGYGARVSITTPMGPQVRHVIVSRSYYSQVEPVATFGLGVARVASTLRVEWPDGELTELRDAPANATHLVRHPSL